MSLPLLGRIDRYVARSVLLAAAVVLLAMLVVVGLFALIEEVREGDEHYGFAAATYYVLLTLPRRLLEILPYGVFLGALVGLGNLASHTELAVLRAAGMSAWRILRGAFAAALVLLAFGVLCGEWLAPLAESRAEFFKNQRLQHDGDDALEGGYWYREGDTFINFESFADDGGLFAVRQYEYAGDRHLALSRFGQRAVHERDAWTLLDARSSKFAPDAVKLHREAAVSVALRADAVQLSRRVLVDADKLSALNLFRQIRYMQGEGIPVQEQLVSLWSRVLQPLAVLGLVALALGFVLGPLREVSMGTRLTVGVLVGLGFKYLQDLFAPMTLVYGLAPWLGVLLPTLACWLVAAVMLRRVG